MKIQFIFNSFEIIFNLLKFYQHSLKSLSIVENILLIHKHDIFRHKLIAETVVVSVRQSEYILRDSSPPFMCRVSQVMCHVFCCCCCCYSFETRRGRPC